MLLPELFFWLFASLALGGGVGMILAKNPVYSVLALILNFFAIGGLYLTLQAEFLAIIQIIVYAGAILVLFLFVVMLLNLDRNQNDALPRYDWRRGAAFVLALGFFGMVLYAFSDGLRGAEGASGAFRWGTAEAMGQMLYTKYLFPFEMAAVILLAALMGALIIAKQPPRETPRPNAAANAPETVPGGASAPGEGPTMPETAATVSGDPPPEAQTHSPLL